MIGEIDASHAAPKQDVRKWINENAAIGAVNAPDPVGYFENGKDIVDWLTREGETKYDGHQERAKVDSRGFLHSGRHAHYYEDNNVNICESFVHRNCK